MSALRSLHLSGIRQLYELREREALAGLNKQRACVKELEHKSLEIQSCIDEFVAQLNLHNEQRLHTQLLTVELLQEDAASRLIVERDLRKERFYLETTVKDLNEAADELKSKHAQWYRHHQQLKALSEIEKKHATIEFHQASLQADRERDELALNRHGVNLNG